jgi:hypothetical protein
MNMNTVKLFESKKIRSVWSQEHQAWYFSIVDVVAVLTDSLNPGAYWRKLKERLKTEGNETVTNCHSLKMEAPDGKMHKDLSKIKKLPVKAEPLRVMHEKH